jgi:hypothetical protein
MLCGKITDGNTDQKICKDRQIRQKNDMRKVQTLGNIERWEERPEMEFFNGIFSQNFWAYKLESSQTRVLAGFLTSFFRSTKLIK